MTKAPAFLKKYFWDIDFAKLDPQKSSGYVIERLLELGDVKAVRWTLKTFPKNVIKKTILTKRSFSPKTALFWATILELDEKDITCLQPQFLNMRQTHWPY